MLHRVSLSTEIISFPSSCETTDISHPGCLHLESLGVLGQAKCITHISELGRAMPGKTSGPSKSPVPSQCEGEADR